ncbi:hypothetical protein K443DRAFT_678151 [Laccaria amethystina LaAM-08-1]|jgi:hypothetical protein|uniref:Uncharacterized protein n=1 Tax=Laccaria amethystina LaAM-08-1 TaxID=1095629 RepID=A0A0C9Y0X6_9AGAR|nr:hypothetical protein K443DRAFT_678151 [Laccaria amethystina LaAM-08-1]
MTCFKDESKPRKREIDPHNVELEHSNVVVGLKTPIEVDTLNEDGYDSGHFYRYDSSGDLMLCSIFYQ